MPADLPKGFGEMKPSARVEAFGRAFEARALSSLDSDVGLVDIREARLRLMECRKAGINPRKQFRRVMEFAERQALLQSSAWAARAKAFREVIETVEANPSVHPSDGASPAVSGATRCSGSE